MAKHIPEEIKKANPKLDDGLLGQSRDLREQLRERGVSKAKFNLAIGGSGSRARTVVRGPSSPPRLKKAR